MSLDPSFEKHLIAITIITTASIRGGFHPARRSVVREIVNRVGYDPDLAGSPKSPASSRLGQDGADEGHIPCVSCSSMTSSAS
jgi:hypothetical protein